MSGRAFQKRNKDSRKTNAIQRGSFFQNAQPYRHVKRENVCPCEGHCPQCSPMQAKLKANTPGDTYEQEADRMAERITAMPKSGLVDQPHPVQDSGIRNKQKANSVSEEGPISNQSGFLGSGKPLPIETRNYFEPRFGRELSSVRIHTDAQANQLANDFKARAFTVQNNIVFNQNEYLPEQADGKRLIAHELTHVMQQTNQQKGSLHRISKVSNSGNDITVQREFDRTQLAQYLAESSNPDVDEDRREEAITRLLDHKEDIIAACRNYGVSKTSFAAAVIWQELYFRGADLTSGLQDWWSEWGPIGGGNWSIGFAQVRPSTAAQVVGDIPFRPRSEMETTNEEFENLPESRQDSYRHLLGNYDLFNIAMAVGYLQLIKNRRYPDIDWLSLSYNELKMIASEYCHGPYPLSHTEPNYNGEQALTIWWGGWFGTDCIRSEFPDL